MHGHVQVVATGRDAVFAGLIGSIVRSNVGRHPARTAFIDGPAAVCRIHASDLGSTATVELRGGTVRVHGGEPAPPAELDVEGPMDALLAVVAAPSWWRAALSCRHVRTRGLWRGRRALRRVRALVTVDP